MVEGKKEGTIESARKNTPGDAPFEYTMELTRLQRRIVEIAQMLMKEHYTLNSRKLHYTCLRMLKDVDKITIMASIDELIRKKVIYPGKAVTRESMMKNKKRVKILEVIKKFPGIYFSKLRQVIKLDSNSLLWHVNMLETFKYIRVEKFGNSTVYFDKELGKENDVFYYYLRKKDTVEILKNTVKHENLSFQDLLYYMNLPRSTLFRKVKVLIKNEILESDTESNRIVSLRVSKKFKIICLECLYNVYWGSEMIF
ncbi:MAG: helix-turn-helix domain-containing protein [Promethearchaeota archaeon]